MAANGATVCDISDGKQIPSDLVAANCVPPGFMVQSGWDIVCDYYQNVDSNRFYSLLLFLLLFVYRLIARRWVPFSVQNVEPFADKSSKATGSFGSLDFTLFPTDDKGKRISAWHDVPLLASAGYKTASSVSSARWTEAYGSQLQAELDKMARTPSTAVFNFVVEIPMYSTAKMEVSKTERGNPIMQDSKNGKPRYATTALRWVRLTGVHLFRYYTYGVPFFNYGLFPQTWEVT